MRCVTVYVKGVEAGVLARFKHSGQQMLRLNGLLASVLGAAHGSLDSLLAFDGVLVDVHIIVSFLFVLKFTCLSRTIIKSFAKRSKVTFCLLYLTFCRVFPLKIFTWENTIKLIPARYKSNK